MDANSRPDVASGDGGGLRLGAWARAGDMVGLVAAIDSDTVSLFDPAQRQQAVVPVSDVTLVPAGAVRVTATVELPLPHGIAEGDVRRWIATLLDDNLRERAFAALADAGLDTGAATPSVRVDVAPVESGTVCLCGARTPAPPGAAIECQRCGRLAVGPPTSSR